MQVYLIAENDGRSRIIQSLLQDRAISCVLQKTVSLKTAGKGIFVFFGLKDTPAIRKKASGLSTKGNIVIALADKKSSPFNVPGIHLFPSNIEDATLVSLIAFFLSYREREDHFDWITDELTKVNRSLLDETTRLKATRDELDARNKKMTEELALANIIQNSLLPRQFPVGVPLNFAHKYIPHEYIGGDFYEILPVDHRHLGILIADVSGHGVSSALITAMLKSVFLHAARDSLSPALVLERINTEFTQVMRTEHYITAFYSIIDVEELSMRFANAGHPRQLIVRKSGAIDAIGANGFFLGMFENSEFEEKSAVLEPGDRLVCYTDGVIECPDQTGAHFGQANLIRVIERYREENIETLSKNIIIELIAFMAASRFPDDITLLITEVIPLL